MSRKRKKKRFCQYCGGEFKSWHGHVDCYRGEPKAKPEPEPERPPFRARAVQGNNVIFIRAR